MTLHPYLVSINPYKTAWFSTYPSIVDESLVGTMGPRHGSLKSLVILGPHMFVAFLNIKPYNPVRGP